MAKTVAWVVLLNWLGHSLDPEESGQTGPRAIAVVSGLVAGVVAFATRTRKDRVRGE